MSHYVTFANHAFSPLRYREAVEIFNLKTKRAYDAPLAERLNVVAKELTDKKQENEAAESARQARVDAEKNKAIIERSKDRHRDPRDVALDEEMRTQRAGIFTRRNTDVFGNFDELLVQYCANKRGYSNERVSIRLLCHLATIEGSRSGGRLVLALDFFSGHRTPDFFAHAWLLDIDLVFVPPRATSKLQVQDIGWNGGLKQNLTNITAATTHINTKNGPVHASTNFTINRLMSALADEGSGGVGCELGEWQEIPSGGRDATQNAGIQFQRPGKAGGVNQHNEVPIFQGRDGGDDVGARKGPHIC